MAVQLWRCMRQHAGQIAEARGRERCIEPDRQAQQGLGLALRRLSERWRLGARCIDTNALIAPCDPQQTLIVHAIEQQRGGTRGTAPVVADAAVLKMRVGGARMHFTAFGGEQQQRLHLAAHRRRGRPPRHARVHQIQMRWCQEAVVDEVVFLHGKLRVMLLQIPGAIPAYALAQDQILGSGRCTDRIGLHKAQAIDRSLQRRRRKQRARDRVVAQRLKPQHRAPIRSSAWRISKAVCITSVPSDDGLRRAPARRRSPCPHSDCSGTP